MKMQRYSDDQLAEIIYDYHRMNHRLQRADCIFVLGSHDPRVAEYAAQLFLDGWAPMMVFSGTGFGHQRTGDLLSTKWKKSEAEVFRDIALQRGVPKEKIIIENKSTNTGENVAFTKRLLAQQGLSCTSFIVVQKPYMERRTYATFKKVWPQPTIIVTSPPLTFSEYVNKDFPKGMVINIIVGDLQRVKEYAQQGWQIPQDIPDAVWRAYEELVKRGYTKHLIKVIERET